MADLPLHIRADYTSLVHVLWAAKHDGLTLDDADAIAEYIWKSDWITAVRTVASAQTQRSEGEA